MTKKAAAAVLVSALLLHACDRAVERAVPADEISKTAAPVAAPTTVQSEAPAADPSPQIPARTDSSSVDAGNSNRTPPVLTPEAEKGIKGARNILLSFARAIELKDFDQAWAMLSPGDKQKWSKAAFARNFADLEKITVAVPNGTTEGAAGSIYYEGPIVITASDNDGRPIRYDGKVVLKRVNDVDGATPAQLRWHFDRLTLDWTH